MIVRLISSLLPLVPLLVAAALCAVLVEAGGFRETFLYNLDDIVFLAQQHIELVLMALIPAAVCGIGIGIVLSRPRMRRAAEGVMQVLNIGNTVPSLAVIALSMSVLGIGTPPVVFALWLVALLPMARNTYAGLSAISEPMLEAATGLGMRPWQKLWRIEVPNALPAILAGLRTSVTIAIGTAPLAFLIGGGGLGELIFSGIAVYDVGTILSGAIPVVLLAQLADANVQVSLPTRKLS
jgi:osmoprotectant transport system permease protein